MNKKHSMDFGLESFRLWSPLESQRNLMDNTGLATISENSTIDI